MPDFSPDADHRFHHHQYLTTVAQEDVRYLLEKDRSYGASWKMAGGRSAWFMLRRKMDRMIEMLKRPAPPTGWSIGNYSAAIPLNGDPNQDVTVDASIARHLLQTYRAEDIFGMIEADPSGRDGCVLAEVRDLRRYLLLVEAEMVARGVVEDTSSQRISTTIPWKGHPELFNGSMTGDEWSSRPGPEHFSGGGISNEDPL